MVVVATLASACGGGAEPSDAGAAVFKAQGCALCHGQDGSGTSFGPTLRGKKSFWTRATLVAYLLNPQAYAEKDARLSAQARKYTLPMTRFDKLTQADIEAVADHVLAMP
jgi:mono/diheme cytochrome c family protein